MEVSMTKAVTVDEVTVKVTLRHSSNHNSIEDYAKEAAQLLMKFYPAPINCHIILDHQKNDFEKNKLAEITAHVPQHDFVAKEAGQTYEQAIDSCLDSLSRQLQKHKEKQRGL